ncbi:hypothetical protein N6H18_11320 [Reichenbachiella agarivorans]|uniref:Uncharacterized protein n=1 Tax=Reichenbachiella agarivorans TaxID=2979464 RepID=A0ABY6CK95_9BACT|nr:hypothetical protein [Reichenbachiella agarivorans]UXP30941.1 hypothetical protein N6H18_11320 [Reichenbachiella agarivorans]
MEVRGSVLMSIDEFVKQRHAGQYSDWKDNLSADTQKLLGNVGAQKWYPVNEGVIEPTIQLCKLFYPDAKKGAWESGRYSAEAALKGVFKIFVLVSTPAFMLKRASRVMTTFYSPTNIEVIATTDKSMLLHLTELPINNELIEYRIGGWMEKALEICGCQNLQFDIKNSLSKGDPYTSYEITWD